MPTVEGRSGNRTGLTPLAQDRFFLFIEWIVIGARSVFISYRLVQVGMSAKNPDVAAGREKNNRRRLVWRERLATSTGVFLLGLASFRRSPFYGVALVIAGTAGVVVSLLFLSAMESGDNGLYDKEPPFESPREIDDAFRDNR